MAKSIDWNSIREEFISSNEEPNISEMSRKYSVSRNSIMSHRDKEGWIQARKQFWSDVEQGVGNELANAKIGSQVEKLSPLISTGDGLCQLIKDRVAVLIKEGDASSKELKELITAYKDLIPAIRSVNNIRTVQELEARQLALDKLELERQRVNVDKYEDNELEITFSNGDDYGK